MHDALWWNAILSHVNDPMTFLLLAAIASFQLDFTQQIVNVNWGGLAVEFKPGFE